MKRHPYRIAALVSLAWAFAGFAGGSYGTAAQSAQPATDITFTKHIAPVLQRSCQRCHRPDGGAPMPLITYEQVRPWARSIKTRTGLGPHAGVMPPWFVEKNIGIQGFKQDPSLSDAGDRDDREVGRLAARRAAILPTCRRRSISRTPTSGSSANRISSCDPPMSSSQRSVRTSGARSAWCRPDSRKIATSRPSKCARSTTFRLAARRRRWVGATCSTT